MRIILLLLIAGSVQAQQAVSDSIATIQVPKGNNRYEIYKMPVFSLASMPDPVQFRVPGGVVMIPKALLAGGDAFHDSIRTAVAGKAATAHTHAIANVTGLQAALDAKSATDHTHAGLPTYSFLASDVVNNNAVANTIADVTGLSFPVSANVTYKFRFFIVYSSAATTTGARFSINGPATTWMHYNSNYTLTAASITTNSGLTAYNLPSASNASALASGNIAIIEGIIRPSASGAVIARFASEVLSSAITVIGGRSFVEYQIIQ